MDQPIYIYSMFSKKYAYYIVYASFDTIFTHYIWHTTATIGLLLIQSYSLCPLLGPLKQEAPVYHTQS
jgi:hypothetical protein